jgi:hypothetical protein
MRTRVTLLGAAMLATAVLAVGTQAATATRLEIPNTTSFRFSWMQLTFTVAGRVVNCEVRLSGSFHERTIAKTMGALHGAVTEATTINLCSGGEARALRETLPWHLRYASYVGTLPRISRLIVQIIGMSFRIQPREMIACLFRSTTIEPANFFIEISEESTMNSIEPAPGEITLQPGGMCEMLGRVKLGNVLRGGVSVLADITSIQVRLI